MDNISYQNGDQMMSDSDFSDPASVSVVCAEAYFPVEYLPCSFEWSYEDPMYGPRLMSETPRYETGKYKGEPLHVYVARMDTSTPTVLGIHSSKYARSQAGYSTVLDQAEMLFPNSADMCTLFGKGERLVFTQNLGDEVDLGNGDVLQPRLVWTSSLNGAWATSVRSMMHRLSCTNQLMGTEPLWRVRRTANHSDLVEARAQILANQIAHAEAYARQAKILASQEFTDEQFRNMIDVLVPDRSEQDISERALNNDLAKRGAMYQKWHQEKQEFGAGSHLMGSKWLAYNAIQGAEQHYINQNWKYDPDKALAKAVEGKTPFADKAWGILVSEYVSA